MNFYDYKSVKALFNNPDVPNFIIGFVAPSNKAAKETLDWITETVKNSNPKINMPRCNFLVLTARDYYNQIGGRPQALVFKELECLKTVHKNNERMAFVRESYRDASGVAHARISRTVEACSPWCLAALSLARATGGGIPGDDTTAIIIGGDTGDVPVSIRSIFDAMFSVPVAVAASEKKEPEVVAPVEPVAKVEVGPPARAFHLLSSEDVPGVLVFGCDDTWKAMEKATSTGDTSVTAYGWQCEAEHEFARDSRSAHALNALKCSLNPITFVAPSNKAAKKTADWAKEQVEKSNPRMNTPRCNFIVLTAQEQFDYMFKLGQRPVAHAEIACLGNRHETVPCNVFMQGDTYRDGFGVHKIMPPKHKPCSSQFCLVSRSKNALRGFPNNDTVVYFRVNVEDIPPIMKDPVVAAILASADN